MKPSFGQKTLSSAGMAVLAGLLVFSLVPPAEASLSLEQAIASVSTPKELAALMKKEFRFEEDQKLFREADHWQSPEEIWNLKAGDCEDYAVFARYVLRKHGIEAEIVSLYGAEGYAHTVVIFKDKDHFRVFNQHKLERFRTKSIKGVLGKLYPQWTWAAIAEPKAARGHIREIFFNNSPAKPSLPHQPFPL